MSSVTPLKIQYTGTTAVGLAEFQAGDTIAPASLPIASTSALGGIKVDGSTVIINSSGVITATPASGAVFSVFGRTGTISLLASDVSTALGYSPYSAANPANYINGNQNITFSGDASGSGTTTVALTLANSGVVAGTYNNAVTTHTPFTVNAKGLITSIGSAVTLTPAFSSITGTPTTLAGYGITNALASSLLGQAYGVALLNSAGVLTTAEIPAFSGDVIIAQGTNTTTLATVNVNTGTYGNATTIPSITVNAKGLVTAVTAVTVTLNSANISNFAAAASAASPVQSVNGFTGVVNVTAASINAVPTSSLGVGSGVATLNSSGYLNSAQIPPSVVGGLNYQGVWDASANNPALASGIGTKGYYYKVSVAGTASIDSQGPWMVGDFIAFDGTTWDRIAGDASEVSSVFGRIGAVVLLSNDVTGALGFTPYNATNPSGYQTASQVSSLISSAAYTLPTASTTVIGGVKIDGSSITISSGVISAVGAVSSVFGRTGAVVMGSGDVTTALGYTPISNAAIIAVANGGTGASTAINARTNLGAAQSGANADITSLQQGVSAPGITGSSNSTVAAAGTTQATATAITADTNVIKTGTGGVIVANAVSNKILTIINRSGVSINIYPAVGHSFDALAVNIPISIQDGGYIELVGSSSTTWNSSLQAVINGSYVVGAVATATSAATVSSAAQPNITSLGTLTGLTVNGNIIGNTTSLTGNVSATTQSAIGTYTFDTFSTTTYRSGKYLIQIEQGTTCFELIDLMIIHNGTLAYITSDRVNNGVSSGITFDAIISAGVLTLSWTLPSATSTIIKASKVLLTL